jgi:hypothetical protein
MSAAWEGSHEAVGIAQGDGTRQGSQVSAVESLSSVTKRTHTEQHLEAHDFPLRIIEDRDSEQDILRTATSLHLPLIGLRYTALPGMIGFI